MAVVSILESVRAPATVVGVAGTKRD